MRRLRDVRLHGGHGRPDHLQATRPGWFVLVLVLAHGDLRTATARASRRPTTTTAPSRFRAQGVEKPRAGRRYESTDRWRRTTATTSFRGSRLATAINTRRTCASTTSSSRQWIRCLDGTAGADTHPRPRSTDWVTVVFSASTDAPAVSISINGVVAATSSQSATSIRATRGGHYGRASTRRSSCTLPRESGSMSYRLTGLQRTWHTHCKGQDTTVHGLAHVGMMRRHRPTRTTAARHPAAPTAAAAGRVPTSCEAPGRGRGRTRRGYDCRSGLRFAGDTNLIERCRNEAGAGFDHDGTRYDNSCALGDDCTTGYWAMECRRRTSTCDAGPRQRAPRSRAHPRDDAITTSWRVGRLNTPATRTHEQPIITTKTSGYDMSQPWGRSDGREGTSSKTTARTTTTTGTTAPRAARSSSATTARRCAGLAGGPERHAA